MTTLLLVLMLFLGAAPHVAQLPRCAQMLGEVWSDARAPRERTRIITASVRRDVETIDLSDLARRFEHPGQEPRGMYTVKMYALTGQTSKRGPFDFLDVQDFDPELQRLMTGLLIESRAEARIQPAVASQVRKIRHERAGALWRYRADPAVMGKLVGESTIAYWRDQKNIEPQARRMYQSGLEVGAWVLTLADGRRLISPIFSDVTPNAHCELEAQGPLERMLASLSPSETVRSAAFFHNHPNGSPILSKMDFDATHELAYRFPQIREFHIYAIAEVHGQIKISHYGVPRPRR